MSKLRNGFLILVVPCHAKRTQQNNETDKNCKYKN